MQFNQPYNPNYQQLNPQYNYQNGYSGYQTQPTTTPINNNRMFNNMLPTVPGKVISSLNDIRPNEVSMDGSVSLFPLNDYSCIYAKAWGQDGTIQTIRYIPEQQKVEETSDPVIEEIRKRLDSIEGMLINSGLCEEVRVNE